MPQFVIESFNLVKFDEYFFYRLGLFFSIEHNITINMVGPQFILDSETKTIESEDKSKSVTFRHINATYEFHKVVRDMHSKYHYFIFRDISWEITETYR